MKRLLLSIMMIIAAAGAEAALVAGKTTVLITGANRGIGLEFVREMADRDWNVVATVRDPAAAKELRALAAAHPGVIIEKLDVTDQAAIDVLAARYKSRPIDILLLNAAITPRYPANFKPFNGMDFELARQSYEVNALGPMRMVRAFLDNVQNSPQKKIIVISSKGGSFAEGPKIPFMYEYRASKAALNMFMYTLSFETAKKGVILTLLSPGMVNTAVGTGIKSPNAIEPTESIGKMLKVMDSLTPADNGKFLNYEDRHEVGW